MFVTRYFAVGLCYLNILRQKTLRNQPFVFKEWVSLSWILTS